MKTATERVQAGMAFLDQTYPDHVQRFNPDNFDIFSLGAKGCVLMQATGETDWWDACAEAGLDIYGPAVLDLGFLPGGGQFQDEDAEDLTKAWIDAYAQRKTA